MLHAPVSDRKNKAEFTNLTTFADCEQQNPRVNWSGRFSSTRDRPNRVPIQQAYGNQAALRMLDSQQSPVVNMLKGGFLQRKCACGNAASAAGTCAECQEKQEMALQTKLRISEPEDEYEREADRIAEQVMRMPDSLVQQQVNPEEKLMQRKATPKPTTLNSNSSFSETPSIVREALNSPGQPLDSETRIFMESRFKHDLSQVRVHTSPKAEASANAVNALAYTVGSDIVFAAGNYAPFVPEGRRLLAHELTHTIQQGGINVKAQRGEATGNILQRTPSCARPASCPPEFCLEYPTRSEAESDRAANRDRLLSQIGQPVLDGGAGEVRSLYRDFLDGGHALRDLSSRLAPFFTRSSTTGRSIRFLDRALETYFRANPPPPGSSTTVDIQDAIPQAITALGTPRDPNVMAFRDYTETPGILAGGVGEGQIACRVGAIPSNVEDGRTATGTATGTNSNGTILVSSSIQFTVTDTLDFCPGHCGGSDAQELTVPLSRYEATGISGDEPFTVTFPAPIGAFDSE
jgi:Domain of unknown function (DUF4157)